MSEGTTNAFFTYVMRQQKEFLTTADKGREVFDRIFDDEKYDLLTFPAMPAPTGRIMVGDPLVYLTAPRFAQHVAPDVAPGEMTLRLAIIKESIAGLRYAAARVEFNDNDAVRYELAELPWSQRPQEAPIPGFPVDAGLACFADEAAVNAYAAFYAQWNAEHPDANIYDDYFAELFHKSYDELPQFQREGGDFIIWTVPETDSTLIFFASGMGDGMYPVYAGYDERGELSNFTVLFLDPDIIDWSGIDSPSRGCIVSKRVANDGHKVGYMERDVPNDSHPATGWLIMSDDEDPGMVDNPDNYVVLRMDTLFDLDPAVIPYLKAPAGSAFVRESETSFKDVSDEQD